MDSTAVIRRRFYKFSCICWSHLPSGYKPEKDVRENLDCWLGQLIIEIKQLSFWDGFPISLMGVKNLIFQAQLLDRKTVVDGLDFLLI